MVWNTTEIRIDPLEKLSDDNSHRLYLLFTSDDYKDLYVFSNKAVFAISNNGQEEKIVLTNNVARRPSKKGEHIQRYQVIGEEIDRGGFGVVVDAPAVIKLDTESETVKVRAKPRIAKFEKKGDVSDAEVSGSKKIYGNQYGITGGISGNMSCMFAPRFPGDNLKTILTGISQKNRPELTIVEQCLASSNLSD